MIFNRYYPVIGGAEQQGRQLAIALHQRGYSVRILTRRLSKSMTPIEDIDGIPVRRLLPTGLSTLSNIGTTIRLFWFLLTDRHRSSLFYVQGVGPIAIASLLAGKLRNIPVVVRASSPGDIIQSHIKSDNTHLLTKWVRRMVFPNWLWHQLLQWAAAVVTLSNDMYEEATQVLPPAKVWQIPNGTRLERFKPMPHQQRTAFRKQLDIPDDALVLLWVGRFVRSKRVDMIIKALAQVRQQQQPTVVLLLVGTAAFQITDIYPELKKLVESYQLQHHVRFICHAEDVTHYYQISDLFIFPSAHEGMPNVVLEAMAARVPVVASRIGGVTDLLDDDSAWLTRAGDLEALYTAIQVALTNQHQRSVYASAAHERAVTNFNLPLMVDKYERLFDTVNTDP